MSFHITPYAVYKQRVFDRLPEDVKREFDSCFKLDVEEVFDAMVREQYDKELAAAFAEADELRSQGYLV